MASVHTIGHSTRSEEEFSELLHAHNIDLLVDVRGKWPFSRHNPQHNKDQLEVWLPKHNIDYIHLPLLGGWQRKQPTLASINGAWRHQGMHNYADYAMTDAFFEGLDKIQELAEHTRIAYMCAEAVPWRCHRLLLSNSWAAFDPELDIFHIMSTTKTIKHKLGMWGASATTTKDEKGRTIVTYPE